MPAHGSRSAKQLPASFGETGPVSDTLYPNWGRTRRQFADIAAQDGVDAAEWYFRAVLKEARGFVPRRSGRPKKTGLRASDLAILFIADLVRAQGPASDREVARAYLRTKKKKITEKDIRRETGHLQRARKLAAGRNVKFPTF